MKEDFAERVEKFYSTLTNKQDFNTFAQVANEFLYQSSLNLFGHITYNWKKHRGLNWNFPDFLTESETGKQFSDKLEALGFLREYAQEFAFNIVDSEFKHHQSRGYYACCLFHNLNPKLK